VVAVVGSKILVVETTAIIITTAAIVTVVAVIDQVVADRVMDKVVATTAVVGVLRSATSFISSYK
jgi:hypothetical protein